MGFCRRTATPCTWRVNLPLILIPGWLVPMFILLLLVQWQRLRASV